MEDEERVFQFGSSSSNLSLDYPDEDEFKAHSRRKAIRRRMLMDCLRALPMQMCATAFQLFLFSSVIFAIWVSWAFIFQDAIHFPELVDVESWGPQQRTQSLAAYSELSSMLVQTILFGTDDEVMKDSANECLQGVLFWNLNNGLGFFSLQNLKLRPQRDKGQYDQTELMASTPIVFIMQETSDTTFTINAHWDNKYGSIEGMLPIKIKIENPLPISLKIDVHFPTPEENIYAFALSFYDVVFPSFWHHLFISLPMNRYKRRFSPFVQPCPVEAEFEKFERRLRAEETFQRSMTGYVGRSSPDQRRYSDIFTSTLQLLESDTDYCFANTPKQFQRRRKEPKRRLQVPFQIEQLTEAEQISGLRLWRFFFKRVLFTFAVNRWYQKDFKESITDLCRSWLKTLGLDLQVIRFDLGMDTFDDAPDIIMSDVQSIYPYTYLITSELKLPRFFLQFSVSSFWKTSSLCISVSNLRMSFNANVRTLHPLFVGRSYLTMTFIDKPILDFDCKIDGDQSKIFGVNIPETVFGWKVQQAMTDFISAYALKSFFLKWSEGLMQTMTFPSQVHIPWYDRPSEFIFSSDIAQSFFMKIRYLFSVQMVKSDINDL